MHDLKTCMSALDKTLTVLHTSDHEIAEPHTYRTYWHKASSREVPWTITM